MKIKLNDKTLAEVNIIILDDLISCCDIKCENLDIKCRDCKFDGGYLHVIESIEGDIVKCGGVIEDDED